MHDDIKAQSFVEFMSSNWTEDWIGLVLALVLFTIATILAYCGQSLADYTDTKEWPVAAAVSGLAVVYIGHYAMGRPQAMASYGVMILIAIVSQSVGFYKALASSGLSPAFWCILFGMFLRNRGYVPDPSITSGEYFVKIGGMTD